MECPICGDPNVYEQKGGPHQFVCPSCGWGKPGGGSRVRRKGLGDIAWLQTRPARAVGLVLLWCLSAVIVFGPWLTAELWFPAKTLGVPMEDFYRYYWFVLGGYVLASWFADVVILGFDRPWMLFAETRREYWNRRGLGAAIELLVIPGRIILHTLVATWRFFRPS